MSTVWNRIVSKLKQNPMLAMALCCGLPLVAILALSSVGLLGSWGYLALILLCPLGHLFMMRGMHKTQADRRMPAHPPESDPKQ